MKEQPAALNKRNTFQPPKQSNFSAISNHQPTGNYRPRPGAKEEPSPNAINTKAEFKHLPRSQFQLLGKVVKWKDKHSIGELLFDSSFTSNSRNNSAQRHWLIDCYGNSHGHYKVFIAGKWLFMHVKNAFLEFLCTTHVGISFCFSYQPSTMTYCNRISWHIRVKIYHLFFLNFHSHLQLREYGDLVVTNMKVS